MNHQITWASIPSSDFDRAVKFYSEVTGLDFKVQGEGDKKMAASLTESEWNDTIGFGITADSTITPGPNGPRLYIAAQDMEALLGKVEENGGKVLAKRNDVPFLGEVPLVQAIREAGDGGVPIAAQENLDTQSQIVTDTFKEIAQKLAQSVALRNAQQNPTEAVSIK
jgi:predicted enzyme related to lactoylglutathione lyase